MKKTIKILISIVLVAVLMLGVGTVAFAEDETVADKLSIISSNVAGLPIPSKFDKDGKVVPHTQKVMGQLLNKSGVDIICVQEDFQYHAILAAQMKNYPYTTYTSGGVPVGDGMNIYSKYPIYNVERVAWEVFNGILDAANDGLTPKGFMKSVMAEHCPAVIESLTGNIDFIDTYILLGMSVNIHIARYDNRSVGGIFIYVSRKLLILGVFKHFV